MQSGEILRSMNEHLDVVPLGPGKAIDVSPVDPSARIATLLGQEEPLGNSIIVVHGTCPCLPDWSAGVSMRWGGRRRPRNARAARPRSEWNVAFVSSVSRPLRGPVVLLVGPLLT